MAVDKGQHAPDATLYNTDRQEIKISDFKGRTTVLAFFPGAFTGTCSSEACSLRDAVTNFNNWNAQVVGINVDSPFANIGWIKANNLNFPVLSDFNRKAIKAYDILLHDFAGLKDYDVAKRSVFVLDRDQVVRYKWVSDDPGVEPPYDEIKNVVNDMK